MNIAYRPATAPDYPFIYSTWLKGLYWGSDWWQMIPRAIYMGHYKRALEGILARNRAIVACLSEDPNVLVGYVVFGQCPSGTTVHFMYVKRPWRKLGIARSLWPEGTVQVSHMTKVAKSILPSNIIFNPFET